MLTRILAPITLVGVLALAIPGDLAAQEMEEGPPSTLVVSQWKCDWDQLGHIAATTDSVLRPIWQELVDEGQLQSAGMFNHEWGDEWNVGFYYVADDKQTFFGAWDEFMRRMQEGHPDLPSLTEYCGEHRDNIYMLGPFANDQTSSGEM